MKTQAFLLHALSPLHAGSGHAADIIDLPTARMKATGLPFMPGSSIKGVLRSARSETAQEKDGEVKAVFGPEIGNASDHAGALVVGDARLLALPVRSFKGTFVWATSPLLLTLAKRDLDGANGAAIPVIAGLGAKAAAGDCLLNERIYLQDVDLPAVQSDQALDWARLLAPLVSPGGDIFTKRFVIVDDETMTFLWETATQVDARVRLDDATRTVASRALWLEESLPPETLLIGLLVADRSRRKETAMTCDQVLEFALPKEETLQFGGKASTGRGRCRMIPIRLEGARRS